MEPSSTQVHPTANVATGLEGCLSSRVIHGPKVTPMRSLLIIDTQKLSLLLLISFGCATMSAQVSYMSKVVQILFLKEKQWPGH